MDVSFKQCISDMCKYYKRDGQDLTIVGVYVKDLLVQLRDKAVEQFFDAVSLLSIKNLGLVSKFLGMRVTAIQTHAYALDQIKAVGKVLREHGVMSGNLTRTAVGDYCYDKAAPDSDLLK